MSAPQDLPDVEGDRQHDIQTFATQLGVRNISLAVRDA
jgi:4-hydroxybenzoate polyprenyltransferase